MTLTWTTALIFWGIVLVVALIASLIHTAIVEYGSFDFEDFFEDFIDDYVWITFVTCLGIGAAIFGFMFWIWWVVLLILVAVIAIVATVSIIVYVRYKKEDEMAQIYNVKEKIQTQFDCKNCGAKITKIIEENCFGNQKVRYICEHCNTVYEKRDLYSLSNKSISAEPCDLDDWEVDYFEACFRLNFKPHNKHTGKQLERRHDSLYDKICNEEIIYDDVDDYDQEEVLDDAQDFFENNEEEIAEYLNSKDPNDIAKRFAYFLQVNQMR